MSEKLLQKLNRARDEKGLITILKQLRLLALVNFVDEPENLLLEKAIIIPYLDEEPWSDLPQNSSDDAVAFWLIKCIEGANLKHRCYLKASYFGSARWSELKVSASNEWIVELWKLSLGSIFLFSTDKNRLLSIHGDEDYYRAYLQIIGPELELA